MGVIGYCGYRVVLTVKVRAFTVYLNEGSAEAALLAAGAVVDLTERVVRCVASVRASATAIPVRAWMGGVSRPLLLTFANGRSLRLLLIRSGEVDKRPALPRAACCTSHPHVLCCMLHAQWRGHEWCGGRTPAWSPCGARRVHGLLPIW